MKRILFLIHDFGQGGTEKVLVNKVNNMDRSKFDISVTVLFWRQCKRTVPCTRYQFPCGISQRSAREQQANEATDTAPAALNICDGALRY